MAVSEKPVFTQRLAMHLNGGSSYSVLEYDVYRDGQKTTIKRVNRTSGSPQYLIVLDVLLQGDEEFDALKAGGVGAREWLESHSSGVVADTPGLPI